MDRKNFTKKKWNQEKVDKFLSFIQTKLRDKKNDRSKEQYFSLFIHLLKDENFKQNLNKCSSIIKVSFTLESLLKSDQVTLEELILLGRTLCKQLFYADLLEKLILLLFKEHVSHNESYEFLKMVWFNKEIICDLPSSWTMYIEKWPSFLESHVFNILSSVKPISSTQLENIWNQSENHYLIKMCVKKDEMFQRVSSILHAMFIDSECDPSFLIVIRQFIESVSDYCERTNKHLVDLYPSAVQTVVMCCTLSRSSLVEHYAQTLPSNWKFILSTHHAKWAEVLMKDKI